MRDKIPGKGRIKIIAHKGRTRELCLQAIVHFVIAKECEPIFSAFIADSDASCDFVETPICGV
jgi:hypothetical protein